MSDIFLVITTLPSQEEAAVLAKSVVAGELAACVQIQGACQSIYRWEGRIEESVEYPVHFKTNAFKHQALREYIRKNHSYETPEIISIRVADVNELYLNWVDEQLGMANK